MGVSTKDECDGDAPVALVCDCGAEYWTDETMMNDCPECSSHYDWEVKENES